MTRPRISTLVAAATSIVIALAAYKTYMPMANLVPDATSVEAKAQCAADANCISAESRMVADAQRRVVRTVLLDFHSAPSTRQLATMRAAIVATRAASTVSVRYSINGAPPPAATPLNRSSKAATK